MYLANSYQIQIVINDFDIWQMIMTPQKAQINDDANLLGKKEG